jgi:hypothetical protein
MASWIHSGSRADQPVFTPLPPYGASRVSAVAVSSNQLCVGFAFNPPVTAPITPPLAQWDGNAWSPLGAGLQPFSQNLNVSAIARSANNLFVAGVFITPDGLATNLAVWNGEQWSGLGSGLDSVYDFVGAFARVSAMAVIGNDLYVGGDFTIAGGHAITNIARWNGNDWFRVGAGIPNNGDVYCMAVAGNNLFVGGHGIMGSQGIAKWDGTNWSSLGSGLGGDVTAITTSGNTVYAGGGEFTTSKMARWDGAAWSPLGAGLTLVPGCLSCSVQALAIAGSDLYVAGEFTEAGGVPVNGFAKWDGTQWTSINLGVSNPPAVIAVVGTNTLYVGGPTFNRATGAYLLRGDLSPVLPPSLAIAVRPNNTAIVTWPSIANTNLQQTSDLGSTNWLVPTETVNDNGVNQSILINLSGGHRFFRLAKP